MEIALFCIGTIFGAFITFIILNSVNKAQIKQDEKLFEIMKIEFENITNRISRETSAEFSKNSNEAIIKMLEPFKERLEIYQKQINENNSKFGALDAQIKQVVHTGNTISNTANNLVSTLKSDNQKQGKWGELVLEKVLEASGLRKGEEFILQQGNNSKRPDATILLPENKAVFVDAKTTLASYDSYINANDGEEKAFHLKEFKESVKSHISNLSKKDYFDTEEYLSPQYVLMFIPIESCYSLLFSENAELWNYAWKNNIMPTSPSTLLAALKIINNFNIVNRQNNNALEIANIAGKMIDKFSDLAKDILLIEKSLGNAKTKLLGKDNLVRQIERMQDLGAKVSSKNYKALEDFSNDDLNSCNIE